MERPPDMNLVVVHPNSRRGVFGALGDDVAAITPPVRQALLCEYAKQEGIHATFIDADLWDFSHEILAAELWWDADYVCISVEPFNSSDTQRMAAAEDLCAALKAADYRGKIIIEASAATENPAETLARTGANYICMGEAFYAVVQIIKHSAAPIVYTEPIQPDELPQTPWHALFPWNYRDHHWHCFADLYARSPYAAIWSSMGCPYHCPYCAVNVLAGKPNLRYRSIESFMSELALLVEMGVRNIRILDCDFTAHQGRAEEICDRIIAAPWPALNMWCYGRVTDIPDLAFLKKLRRAGITTMAYGIESATSGIRTATHKTIASDRLDQVMEWTKQADISQSSNWMFGMPGDTMASMRATLDQAKLYLPEWANFYCVQAYPGTKLHSEASAKGLPLPTAWTGYGQYTPDALPLPTEALTSKEILAFRDYAFQEYLHYEPYRKMIVKRYGQPALDFIDNKILAVKVVRA